MAAVAFTVAVGAVVAFIAWYLLNLRKRKLVNKLEGPPDLPIIGNAHILPVDGNAFFDTVMQMWRDYKSKGMFRLWLGPRPMIAVFQAETVETLLHSSKHIEKAPEYRFLWPWLGTGLLTSKGEKWFTRRKMLTPTFHFRILNDFVSVFNEQSAIMVEVLWSKATSRPFNIFPHITHCALDIICESAMGQSVGAQKDSDSDYVKAVYLASELVHRRQKSPWLWPDSIYNTFSRGREWQRCLSVLHGFTERVIGERREEFEASARLREEAKEAAEGGISEEWAEGKSHVRLAFLDMLLYCSDGGKALTDADIREEVDTFMFEGHDTTAAAANWATHLIGCDPEVQRRVQQEQDEIFGDDRHKAVTREDLARMKYLECCVKEALRLFPSVPMFGRDLKQDMKCGEYTIPADSSMIVLTSALHRDPKYFPDPEKYDPERFLPENCAGRHPYAYVPFSAGPRNCIGQKFALMEEKVMLSYLFRNFNVTSTQSREELKPVGEIILRPKDGIWVKLSPRE